MLASLIFIAAGYLLGSVSFAVVTSKLLGLPDPHSYGSGNPGATNVLRTGNKAAAALTLVGDGAKGWFAVWLAQRLGPHFDVADWAVPGVALAVFLGHLYPVFHRFAGGKGVATAAGIVAALQWPLAAVLAVVWLIIAVGFRISSLAAARRRRADADRHVLSDRQFAFRVGDGGRRRTAVLAASNQHPPAPRRQGARDRALTRAGYGASSDASSQRGRTENA